MQQNSKSFLDRWYIAVMVPVASFVMYCNWYADHNVGGLHYYKHYASLIRTGFAGEHLPTFPMWGYGWLMSITQDKLTLLCIEMVFALCTLYWALRIIEQENIFSATVIRALKVGMVVSIPWYAFHALRWPSGIAASLFLVALPLLYRAVIRKQKNWVYLIGSALCFGVLLHFRSDYFLMPIGLAVIVVGFFRTKQSFLQMLVWLIVLYGCLAPWAFYTKKACGHYLVTSTNGGHVAFIGLGHDSKNRWGITVSDGDPVMHHVVNEHFKTVRHSTLDYEADQVLKRTFLEYITAYPWDYVRKCVYNLFLVVTQGFYPGEFFLDEYGEMPFLKQARIRELVTHVIENPSLILSHSAEVFRIFLTASSYGASIILLLASYFLLPLTVCVALYRKSLFILLVFAALMYQTLMSGLAQNMPSYTSNLYVFYLLNTIYGISLLRAFLLHYKSVVGTYRNPFKIVF